MRRNLRHTLLCGSLLGLLVGCGQLPGGGAESISGTVTAPSGRDVAGTRVFACYENERNCDALGEVNLTASAATQTYQLGRLAPGSYGVYALKDANGDGDMVGDGDFYGFYNPNAGESSLVKPPAANIDIQMYVLTGVGSVPKVIHELSTKTP